MTRKERREKRAAQEQERAALCYRYSLEESFNPEWARGWQECAAIAAEDARIFLESAMSLSESEEIGIRYLFLGG